MHLESAAGAPYLFMSSSRSLAANFDNVDVQRTTPVLVTYFSFARALNNYPHLIGHDFGDYSEVGATVPPPRITQKRSGSVFSDTSTMFPFARTTVTARRLSITMPCFPPLMNLGHRRRRSPVSLAAPMATVYLPDDEDKITNFIEANTIQAQPPNYWGVDKYGSLKVDRFTHKTNQKDRFVGYRAVHYRVKLQEEISDDSNLANKSESLKSWWRGQWKQHSDDSWAEKDVEI
ncbi:hypothetical protein DL98DRAFT_542460 [Cadophora sp. DSE1049]|nr:hypothetical protein DL98DRAFT_542460 [Cadophora sp. DSE1049]